MICPFCLSDSVNSPLSLFVCFGGVPYGEHSHYFFYESDEYFYSVLHLNNRMNSITIGAEPDYFISMKSVDSLDFNKIPISDFSPCQSLELISKYMALRGFL